MNGIECALGILSAEFVEALPNGLLFILLARDLELQWLIIGSFSYQ